MYTEQSTKQSQEKITGEEGEWPSVGRGVEEPRQGTAACGRSPQSARSSQRLSALNRCTSSPPMRDRAGCRTKSVVCSRARAASLVIIMV